MIFSVKRPAFILYIDINFTKKIMNERNLRVSKVETCNWRLTDTPQNRVNCG